MTKQKIYGQKKIEIKNLLDIEQTISKPIFENCKYPWEVINKIEDFIIQLGNSLDKEKFKKVSENIWIAKSAKIAETASITGPCIIDEGAEIRHCAFIRKNAIIGKGTVVGNSTEIKNVILFDKVQAPHFSYIGDSILGYKAHLGAGAKISNVKSDKTNVKIKFDECVIETNLRKFGAIVGDFVEIGCNSVLNPGTIIGRNTNIYPLSSVRGVIGENCIYKEHNKIINKK